MTAHGILERRQRTDLDNPHGRIETLHTQAQRDAEHRMLIRDNDDSFLPHDPQAPRASPAAFIGLRLPAPSDSSGMRSTAEMSTSASHPRSSPWDAIHRDDRPSPGPDPATQTSVSSAK